METSRRVGLLVPSSNTVMEPDLWRALPPGASLHTGGVPTVSVIASVRRAIAAGGARRVGVVTPYVDALNQRIKESVEAGGVEVAVIAGLGISDNFEIAAVPVEEILDFAERTLRGLAVDLAFVSCTNFPAVAALPELERRLGLPVVTSNQAAIAAVLALLDAAPARQGG